MRFIHIEDFFHPDAGYQLNILAKLQAKEGHEITIITAELEKIPDFMTSFFGKNNLDKKDRVYEQNTGVKIIRLPIWKYYSGRVIFKRGIFKVIKELKPDVLFLHGESTFTAISFLLKYKKLNIPMVMDSHMLEMASINKFRSIFRLFYRIFITPIIIKNDIPMIRVVDSDFVEKILGIPLVKTHLLSFGTDVDYFAPNLQTKKKFREELKIGKNDFVVIYAGKLDETKGGLFLAESLKEKIQLKNDRQIVFIIIGNVPKDEYGDKTEEVFKNSENRIIRFPTQTYMNLARYYQVADIAIFPKQCSLSYFDVQSTQLPVVLEVNEINMERVENRKGLLFSENNPTEFREGITTFGNMNSKEFETYKVSSRKNIVENYNYTPVAHKYTNIMLSEYNKFHNK